MTACVTDARRRSLIVGDEHLVAVNSFDNEKNVRRLLGHTHVSGHLVANSNFLPSPGGQFLREIAGAQRHWNIDPRFLEERAQRGSTSVVQSVAIPIRGHCPGGGVLNLCNAVRAGTESDQVGNSSSSLAEDASAAPNANCSAERASSELN